MNCPICGEKMMWETRLNMITYKTTDVNHCVNGHFCKAGATFDNPTARWTGEIVESGIDEDDEDEDAPEPHYQSEYERDNPRDTPEVRG